MHAEKTIYVKKNDLLIPKTHFTKIEIEGRWQDE